MDVRYRISRGVEVVSGSSATSDSNALRLEFATKARGSCGVDPMPLRLRIVTLSVSRMGDWLYGVRKRLVFVMSLMSSTFAILHLTVMTV